MITAQLPAEHFLTFDFTKVCKLILPAYKKVTLALIGCGGTGSWLAPAVARIGMLLIEKLEKEVRLVFIDPDWVEEKNVYRQNFCRAEVGRNKAQALAWRYGLAWGLEIEAVSEPFWAGELGWSDLAVLIGCVDNTAARSEIAKESRQRDAWWLDCGNEKASGQALLGSGSGRPDDPFKLPGFCSWLPLPSKQHPELVEAGSALPGHAGPEAAMSCAEMAMQDAQGLMVNQRMAAEAGDILSRMLLTKDLTRYATYFDLLSGSARSKYIIKEAV